MKLIVAASSLDRARSRLAWLVEPLKKWSADRCSLLSAAIAFYAAFSLAPTLVMAIGAASIFVGADAVRGQLFGQLRGFMGDAAAAGLQAMVANAWHTKGAGGFTIVSVVALIVGASATFSSLNTTLDVVWPAAGAQKGSAVISMLRVRLISFGLVLGIGFLVVASLILTSLIEFAGKWIWGDGNPVYVVALAIQLLVSLFVLTIAFAALLRFLPDAHIEWRDCLRGGFVSALLFNAGKGLFALYLARAGMASTFGAAGSLAVTLMWLYYSAAVLLLGAEFAWYSAHRQTPARPRPVQR